VRAFPRGNPWWGPDGRDVFEGKGKPALKDETIKGSIALGGDSAGFLEREERRNNPQHQRIIRRPLKECVTHKAGRWLTPENAS